MFNTRKNIIRYNQYIIESKIVKFPNIKKITVDDFIVYVGMDAKSNDHLTFNIASDDDYWFHVKGIPGSHVVLKIKDKLPTDLTLKYICEIAKKYSKAKNVENTNVIYCKRRFVKKEVGMNDGEVRVDYINSNKIVV